ncbi:MAG: hypothetical protein KIT27_09445 [Legionellales bacterium]|nr:hypothetical protein [Legionellales bacterium]
MSEIIEGKAMVKKRTAQLIKKVIKRDSKEVNFDLERITTAIHKAMEVANEGSFQEAKAVATRVQNELEEIRRRYKSFIPDVEGIQDAVEKNLMFENYAKTAKAYILYRQERAKAREQKIVIPAHIQKMAEESRRYFKNPLAEFVYLRTYARWIPAEKRRETWIETVDRYMNFMKNHLGDKLTPREYKEIRQAILQQDIMPSMRLLQFAGPAAEATHVCAYNCSFIAPRNLRDFGEVMYISMCGTGVGFSVESQNIQALPQIKPQTGKMLPTHVIPDSKEGWCDALILGMTTWFDGNDILFDFSQLRPAGARLKTMGGKSSGPDPLRDLLNFTRAIILKRQGRRLTNIDAHDILCKIGEVVVSGGVRRSAMISLSDLDDPLMRQAKSGQFFYNEPQRCMANNSAVYTQKPDNATLLEEWLALVKSGSGERGIFNRAGLTQTLPKRRIEYLTQKNIIQNDTIVGIIGTNPCAEIILQSKQFCNLSEIVARAEDDEERLLQKIKLATILGTFQATLTHFPYLSPEWQKNCEEEALLGVSITGQWDCEAARDARTLQKLKQKALSINKKYAERFAINPSTCVTCVKPSGTVSQVVDCASGMHPRHAPYYIRRIRIAATDALFKMLKDQGVPYHPEVGQSEENATTFVLEFPVKAPNVKAVYRDDLTALEFLEHWKTVKLNYTEHNPSVTISVGDDEWLEVANWVNQNWDIVGGLSFLPRDNHVYHLAPYETIDKQRYQELLKRFEKIDFSQLIIYERNDETEVKKELACVGGVCEL